MPGLLRGVARVAVVAGTATAVSNRVSRRQGGRWARQDQEQAAEQEPAQEEPAEQEPAQEEEPPAPAPSGMTDRLAQLKELGELKTQGVLTDAEFEQQKSQILNS